VNKILLLISGMMLVTYIPRLLPFIIISGKDLPKGVRKFLLYIPPAALGALIIPGVFSAIPEKPAAALAGIIFACVYAWYRGGIIIPVLGSIAAAFLVLLAK
jgi:branched-subunit amino acid transport protein